MSGSIGPITRNQKSFKDHSQYPLSALKKYEYNNNSHHVKTASGFISAQSDLFLECEVNQS
jgi:hypothetical protein